MSVLNSVENKVGASSAVRSILTYDDDETENSMLPIERTENYVAMQKTFYGRENRRKEEMRRSSRVLEAYLTFR
jgi:hypothetical protein